MAEHHDDPANWPALGRAISWVDRPGNGTKLAIWLSVACTLTLVAQFLFHYHPHFAPEKLFGFYAVYGFVMFIGLIFTAKGLRVLAKRREDYYAPNVIDTEEYPEDGLDKEDVDD